MLLSKACNLIGIVVIAYARHGCFAPNSVANLFRGEQQKNIDWAFLQALKTTHVDPQQGIMLIYDIACQYMVHLKDRIRHLWLTGLTVDGAIGLFHVHGHKDVCFFRFATSFILGAVVLIGEILESLWANLNAVAPAMRTATLAHRAEIMDDHMTDSNHKKSLAMSRTLAERYIQAATICESARDYYDKLASGIILEDIKIWEDEISHAERDHMRDRSVMDIMGANTQDKDPAAAGHGDTDVNDDPVI